MLKYFPEKRMNAGFSFSMLEERSSLYRTERQRYFHCHSHVAIAMLKRREEKIMKEQSRAEKRREEKRGTERRGKERA